MAVLTSLPLKSCDNLGAGQHPCDERYDFFQFHMPGKVAVRIANVHNRDPAILNKAFDHMAKLGGHRVMIGDWNLQPCDIGKYLAAGEYHYSESIEEEGKTTRPGSTRHIDYGIHTVDVPLKRVQTSSDHDLVIYDMGYYSCEDWYPTAPKKPMCKKEGPIDDAARAKRCGSEQRERLAALLKEGRPTSPTSCCPTRPNEH